MKKRLLCCWILVLFSPLIGCGPEPEELSFAPLTPEERRIIDETWGHAQRADGGSVLARMVIAADPGPLNPSRMSRYLKFRLEVEPWLKAELREVEQVPTPTRLIAGINRVLNPDPDKRARMRTRIRQGEPVLVRLTLANGRTLYQAWLREDDDLRLLIDPLDITERDKRMLMGEEVTDEERRRS